MENLIIIFVLLLLGMLLSRLQILPQNASQSLNLFVIYISLPALILLQVPRLTFSKELLVPVLMPWVMVVVSALLVLLASRLFKWQRPTTGALLLMVGLDLAVSMHAGVMQTANRAPYLAPFLISGIATIVLGLVLGSRWGISGVIAAALLAQVPLNYIWVPWQCWRDLHTWTSTT